MSLPQVSLRISYESPITLTDMPRSVTAFAPASVSNVCSGFDIMGFALERPGDTVTVRYCDSPGVRIAALRGETNGLPLDASLNTAVAPVAALLRDFGAGIGVEIELVKGLPPGSGIGSSAASAVAAAVAANALFGAGLQPRELLKYAIEGERIASGSVHADNVAPSLLGGYVLIRGYEPIDIVQIPVPDGLWCTVVCPDVVIRTKEARDILPAAISLRDVVAQTGNAAGLVAGLIMGDFGLVGRSLHDVVAEPARAKLIPGFDRLKSEALDAGALGSGISGSGPALFALSTTREVAEHVGDRLTEVLTSRGVRSLKYVSTISKIGAHIVEEAP